MRSSVWSRRGCCIGIAAPTTVQTNDRVTAGPALDNATRPLNCRAMAMEKKRLLDVRQLSHRYATGQQAIGELTFGVDDGELVSIVGPSGCGKTTLLKSIAGLQKHTGGSVSVDG